MTLALIVAGMSAFIAWSGYRIKYRGRVDLIAGVKDPSTLANPKALGDWVGNMSFVGAVVLAAGAAMVAAAPSSLRLVVMFFTILAYAGTLFAMVSGAHSRSRRRQG